MIHLLRRTRRHRLTRCLLVTTLSLLLPAQDLLARGGGFGGGGFHGGGGGFHGGGGGFHGGGSFGGGGGGYRGGGGSFGGGGYHGGAGGGGGRPFNPGASHSFGGGGGHSGGGFGGGGMGGNRPPVTGGGGRGGIGGGGIGGGGIGGSGRGGEGIGGRGGQGIGGGGRGGEGIGGRGGNQGIGNRGGNQGIGNRGGNNIGNRSGNNFNRGNTNIGNNVNINNNHFNNGAWGNHYGNFHNYNNYWHHGYWHGGWGGWGWGGWGWGWGWGWGGLAAASLIGWGLGSMYASSGYGGGYYNPYCGDCASSSQAYLDYSQPIQPTAAPQTASTDGSSAQPPSPEVAAALVPFDAAREAFKAGNYDESLRKVEEALQKLPSDAALHEFRALVLFALGRYKECASALYAVLSAGPGWDWTTLSSMYSSVDVYTKQLRALEAFGKQNPDSPDAAFVMAYHYLTCGYKEAAAKELQTVIRLLPNDQLAPRLLNLVNGGSPQQGTEPAPGPKITPASPDTSSNDAPNPQAQVDSGPPVDRAKILGTWKATSGGDPHKVNIELTLKDDGSFTWKVTQGARTNTIEGTYTLDVSTLDLKQKKDGDSMTGKVTLDDKGGFNFKLLETGPGDPGLNFGK